MENKVFFLALKRWFYGARSYEPIPDRLRLFIDTVTGLQDLFGSDIETEHPEIPSGDMFIFFEAIHPIIHDTERFSELISRMKNIEFYSLADGKVHFGARFADVYNVEILDE